MSKTIKTTMTDLLRRALAQSKSINAVAVATGVQKASLLRFARGKQSLRLDIADKLAAYFDIESTWKGR
ncbi:MAG: helix-turn-helix domain-containing protein [Planctomycetes bacterium]|nr:helix-turn-helix domain-containing protein [Planctomycetota bacterium]